MEVYYYIPVDEKEDALSCGIKLSSKIDKKVTVNNHPAPCISALLNPKDDMDKYTSDKYVCLRIEIKPDYCYIADKTLYGSEKTRELYSCSIISPLNYVFGTYRNPECLITCTILPDSIHLMNKAIDAPVLYDNSENLYINRLFDELQEENPDFNETALTLFFDFLSNNGDLTRIDNNNMLVYTSQTGKVYTLKKGRTMA